MLGTHVQVCRSRVRNIDIDKVPLKISVFTSKRLVFKYIFSTENYNVWNNKDILLKQKSRVIEPWFDNTIVQVSPLFNKDGLIVLKVWLQWFACWELKIHLLSWPDTSVSRVCLTYSLGQNNIVIRLLFKRDISTVPTGISYWSKYVEKMDWTKVWLLPNRNLLPQKFKAVSFKWSHAVFPSMNTLFQKRCGHKMQFLLWSF